jgi:hypothetical protein
MACLSETVRVGVERMPVSLGSALRAAPRLMRALEVASREEDLAEAVYYNIDDS